MASSRGIPHRRAKGHLRRLFQEFGDVSACHVGDAFDLLFHPQVLSVVEVQEGLPVPVLLPDRIDHEAAAPFEVFHGLHDGFPGGRRVDHGV